jgi:peptidoglycan/xylan/chitin deacetylase (PgdA/CDA1 family)
MKESISSASTRKSAKGAIILIYHRVVDANFDPYGITVAPDRFRRHMQYLKRNYNITSLDGLVSVLKQGGTLKESVVLTFDDGYNDNYIHARPILEKLHIPATFFIPTSYINTNKAFWWDRLSRVFHPTRKLPSRIPLFNCTLSDPDRRAEAFWRIYQVLKSSSPQGIDKVCAYLEQWAGLGEFNDSSSRVMTKENIRRLADTGLFQIGAHTHYHSNLASQSALLQRQEIQQSKKKLERITNHPIRYFSYPYGAKYNYSALITRIVKHSGFEAACSAYPGIVDKDTDLYELPRCWIGNWGLTRFRQAIDQFFHR